MAPFWGLSGSVFVQLSSPLSYSFMWEVPVRLCRFCGHAWSCSLFSPSSLGLVSGSSCPWHGWRRNFFSPQVWWPPSAAGYEGSPHSWWLSHPLQLAETTCYAQLCPSVSTILDPVFNLSVLLSFYFHFIILWRDLTKVIFILRSPDLHVPAGNRNRASTVGGEHSRKEAIRTACQ